jgi:surfactin synthase thioesterase subunit
MSRPSDENRSGVPQVVLVHGACHGPWCWEAVLGLLRSYGLDVHTVELPLTSLGADADVVRMAVRNAKQAGPVLLAGHSYGGVVISEGGHEADELLYCAATMPDKGQSATDLFPRLFTPELADSIDTSEDGAVLTLNPAGSVPAFFNRCSPDLVARIVPRLRPMRQECFTACVEHPAWLEVPASYIVCTDDHAMAVTYQQECASLLGDFVTFDSDHSLFYTTPDELVERIVDIAHRMADDPAAKPV